MMFIQNVRRTLECLFVSVYSKSTMHIVHFSLGVVLYSTFSLAVLSEAPGLKEAQGLNFLSILHYDQKVGGGGLFYV